MSHGRINAGITYKLQRSLYGQHQDGVTNNSSRSLWLEPAGQPATYWVRLIAHTSEIQNNSTIKRQHRGSNSTQQTEAATVVNNQRQ